MDRAHYALWERCRAFVGHVCAGRDASHGLGHMEKVTEHAVLLYLMSRTPAKPAEAEALKRIILVGMLHDVADHKYDDDGQLMLRVQRFLTSEVAGSGVASTHGDAADDDVDAQVSHALSSLEAVSYSKENKRGMRWFESSLPAEWTEARDYVSDADKLDAIGTDGLMRCYEYTCHTFRERRAASASREPLFASVSSLEAALLKDVSDHYDEKLCRLAAEFIVTPEGKFLAAPRQAAMADLLADWKARGPPPVTLYWSDAPQCCGDALA